MNLLESLESRTLLSVVVPHAKPKQAPPTVATVLISQQPKPSVKAGATERMVVQLRDSSGHIITTASDSVTLKIATGPNGGGMFGTITVKAVKGIATFNNFSFGKIGTYKLKVVDGKVSSANSQAVSVALGPAAKVKIVSTFPTNAQKVPTGAVGPVVVDVIDSGGNVVNSPTAIRFNVVSTNSNSAGWNVQGTFVVGETVTQATSGATGVVSAVTTSSVGSTSSITSVSVNVTGGSFNAADIITGSTSGATLTPANNPTLPNTNSTVNVVLNTTLSTATVPGTVSQVASGSATTINGVATINLAGSTGTTGTSTSNTTNTPAALGLKPGYYTMIVTDGTLISQTLQIYIH